MPKEDCYWYVDRTVPEDKQTIQVMCTDCYKKENFEEYALHERPWFWNGSKLGYGDYDLNCSLCGHVIYLREKPDGKKAETSIQG